MILRSRVLYCNVHSPSLLTIHSRLFTITNDQGCYSNVPFLAWDLKRTFQLCSFCTSFWGPGPQWAVVRRPWLAAHLVPSLCAARIQQHSSTVQHPQGPNNSLNNFKSLHFDCSIFGETWDQRETAGAVLAILRFTGHRFLAQIVPSLRSQGEQTAPVQYHSRYWWEVLHGCLQFTESILNDSQWVHKMHGLEMKAFSSFFIPMNLRSIQSPPWRQAGATHLGPPLIPTNTLSRTTRGMASLVSRNRVVSPERQQRDWQRQKNDFTLDEEYMCEAPSFVGMLTYVTIEYIGILYIYICTQMYIYIYWYNIYILI